MGPGLANKCQTILFLQKIGNLNGCEPVGEMMTCLTYLLFDSYFDS